MGNQELYLLGYEDMEEFRNYHNDFADLFVNKPGFVFKFKNFSWIDYTQHSGTPNRRVLIRTKNGKEIETSLNISEIYLQKEINGSMLFFSVELMNIPFKHDLPLSVNQPQYEEPTLEELNSPIISYENSLEEDALLPQTPPVSFEVSSLATESTFNEDFTSSFNTTLPLADDLNEFKITDSTPSEPEDTFDFKLKFDHEILQESPVIIEEESLSAPLEYESIDQIEIKDLDFVISTESYPEDNVKDLLEDSTLHIESLETFSNSTNILDAEEFDLSECAEALGLDINTLAQIIEEYINTLDLNIPQLEEAIHANNRKRAKEEISNLKSIALHLQILSLFHHFEHLETSLEFDTKEEIVQIFHTLKKAIVSFKESVL